MHKTAFFELCAETLEAAQIAQSEGADRIELCGHLAISGITPGRALISATVRSISIPVHVLIRPRGGDFVYSHDEFELIRQQTLMAKALGAAGVAIGILQADGRVDVSRTREIAQLAAPLKVTFHRAFDETLNLSDALEDVIRTGADCLLTSGGKANVMAGASAIAALVKQAGARLTVMAGGGLSLSNAAEVVRLTGASYLHGSLIRKPEKSLAGARLPSHHAADDSAPIGNVYPEDVREVIRLMNQAAEPQLTR